MKCLPHACPYHVYAWVWSSPIQDDKAHAWSCAIILIDEILPASAHTIGEIDMIFDTWSCFSLSACTAVASQWSKRRTGSAIFPTSACTNLQRAICMWSCFSSSACVRAPPAGRRRRRRGQNAVRADRSWVRNICPGWKRRDSFGTYGAYWMCCHLLRTCLLAERKVVAASSMRDHALSKRELALHLPGPRALWGW